MHTRRSRPHASPGKDATRDFYGTHAGVDHAGSGFGGARRAGIVRCRSESGGIYGRQRWLVEDWSRLGCGLGGDATVGTMATQAAVRYTGASDAEARRRSCAD